MHAYSAPAPRAVAREATVLHHLRNRSQGCLRLTAQEWTPGTQARFALDSFTAELEPGMSCCFASCFGSELVLNLLWRGQEEPQIYQLRLPPGGGLPLWSPQGAGLIHHGIVELHGPGLPQWILLTDITGQFLERATSMRQLPADIPEALRKAGCHSQALQWERDPPQGCESGPCTVFGVPDGLNLPSCLLADLVVLDVTLFFHGRQELQGSESTASGGSLRYSVRDGVLQIIARSKDGKLVLAATGDGNALLRTRDRHRVVYALSN